MSDAVEKITDMEKICNLIRIDARDNVDKKEVIKRLMTYVETKGMTEDQIVELVDLIYKTKDIPTVVLGDKRKTKHKEQKENDSIRTATSLTIEQKDGTKKRYEEIRDPRSEICQYITWNKTIQDYVKVPQVIDEIKKLTYLPVCNEESGVREEVILFPTEPEDYISFENLYNEIDKYVVKYLDIDPEKRRLANYIIILDGFIDGLNTMPMLRFLGLSGRGKTRAVTTYGCISYLPIMIASPNAANIFRILTTYTDATLVMNEDVDLSNNAIKNSENKETVRAILLNGWERKFKIPRHNNATGKDEYFSTFGLKVFSSYRATSFSAFENRCLTVDVLETERNDIVINLDKEFLTDALHIRNILLDFKLKNADVDFTKYNKLTFGDFGANVSRRVCQATAPLMRLEIFDSSIKEFLLQLAIQRNLDEITRNTETEEGKFFKKYIEFMTDKENPKTDVTTNEIKTQLGDFYKEWGMNAINDRFRQLGFEIETKKLKSGRTREYHIVYNEHLISKTILKYILPEDQVNENGVDLMYIILDTKKCEEKLGQQKITGVD